MSDTDDGFDEEAARRELREKYEDEREDRETTARMSELLLQGATMTNQHCDRCGSPIFRYEGQEFCPTCQHEAQQANAEQAAEAEQQSEAAQQSDAEQQTDAEQATPAQSERQTPDQQESGESTESAESADIHASSTANRRTAPSQNATEQPPADSPSSPQQRAGGRGGSEAEAALESSISALARRAASADDPRTATEYLEAAREAAEALAALRHNA